MKITTTALVQTNLTAVLPDSYKGASQEAIQQALLDGEAQVLDVEYPTANEAFSAACSELADGYSSFETDDTPLNKEEEEALSLQQHFTYFYS